MDENRLKLEEHLHRLLQEKDEKEQLIERQDADITQFLSKVNNQRLAVAKKKGEIDELLQDTEDLEAELDSKSAELGDIRNLPTGSTHSTHNNITDIKASLGNLNVQLDRKKQDQQELRHILQNEQKAREDFVASSFACITDIETKIREAMEREQKMGSMPPTDPIKALNEIAEVQKTREDQIKAIHEEYGRVLDLNQQKDEELANVKERTKRDIPLIQAKRDDEIIQIKDQWQREKKVYLKKFDKLFAINKEQKFHIQRGTHIKPEKVHPPTMTDQKLNDENAELAAAVRDLQKRVEDGKEENRDLMKQHQSMIAQSEKDHRDFERARDERIRLIEEEMALVQELRKSNRNLQSTIAAVKQKGNLINKANAENMTKRADEPPPVHTRTQPGTFLKKRAGTGGGSHPRDTYARKENRYLRTTKKP